MSPKTTALVLFTICVALLSPSANGVEEDDIRCLKSIKQSLEDPLGKLSSWGFTNTTEICNTFVGISCWNDQESRLLSLELRDMGLGGSFPRGIEYCGSLTKLDLSGNKLSGSIPSDLCGRVKFVTHLDLSDNYFSGEIPAAISDCYYLNTLALNNNKLSGGIPEGIRSLSRLKRFDVSDNELVGDVPGEFGAASYANNEGLCGGPLEPCRHKGKQQKIHFSTFMVGFGIGWLVCTLLCFIGLTFFNRQRWSSLLKE